MGAWLYMELGRMRGIKYRLYRQNGIIVLSIVLMFEVIFLWVVRTYYVESATKQLVNRANLLGETYNKYLINETIYEKAKYILENEYMNNTFYMQVIDMDGNTITDSYGLMIGNVAYAEDVEEALLGRNKVVMARDQAHGESVMAISIPLYRLDHIVGVLRYVISVEDIRAMVSFISNLALAIGIAVIMMMFILSSFLARGIVEPVKELTNIAEIMASGDFTKRASKKKEDEIGRLSDTLNFMAKEIEKSEIVKNEFISSISHELRTPLTAIRGWSEIILTGEIESKEEEQEGLKIISTEAKRLSGLVEELLDFSKFQSGKITLDLKDVPIKALLEEVYTHFKIRFGQEGIKASLKLHERDCIIPGDESRLKQVFINIIDNAIKFTGENGSISIRTILKDKYVVIEIEDNGIGIPEEDLKKVTEKFYKGKSRGAGSGIGLAISKEIILLHHGQLHINSIHGRGTTLGIELPIKL